MSPRIPADDLPHDKHGIREYGVMLHASARQNGALRKFHAVAGISDFATRAHVSVENFGEPTDLGEVMRRLSEIAVRTRPFRIKLDPEGAKPWGKGGAGGYEVELTEPLSAFQESVEKALSSVTKSIHAPGRKYHPHVTAYLATDEVGSARARKLLPELDLGSGYIARSVELSGRRGPARGGSYTVLASFPFSLRVGPADPPL